MRIRLSADAKRDIDREVDYLRGKTNSGIVVFRNIIARARHVLASQPEAGHTASALPLRGARRLIIGGWHFDYDVVDDTIWVRRITSSVNTPSLHYDDDADYEDPPK